MVKSPVRLSVLFVSVLLAACEIGTIKIGGDPVAPAVFACAAVTGIPVAECEVLAALYNETNGPNWTDNTGWLETNTPCNWFGVICSDGQVGEIDVRSNGLVGPIPAELGNLSNLHVLRLGSQLTGTIPPELGNLSNLSFLGLGNNQLTGTIPPELGNLSNLNQLALAQNQLTGPVPPELGNLSSLDRFLLHRNQLEGLVPFSVANLGGEVERIGQCRFDANPSLSLPNSQDYMDADLNSDGFICGIPLGPVPANAISLVMSAPPGGTTLSGGQVVLFTATVSYELNNGASGEIRMHIQDQTGANIQSGVRPVVTIGRGGGTVTLSDQVTIPAIGVTTINVFLSLSSAGQISTGDVVRVSYPVQ